MCVCVCGIALACSGHVDDVGASLCGRTIIQRARGWIVESQGGTAAAGELVAERESRRTVICGGRGWSDGGWRVEE